MGSTQMHPDNVETIINRMVNLSKSDFFIWQFFLSVVVLRGEDETAHGHDRWITTSVPARWHRHQ